MEVLNANNFQIHEELDRADVLLGFHDKKYTGKRICLRTGIYENDFNNPALHHAPYKGRGWHADFRTYDYQGNIRHDNYQVVMLDLRERGYIWDSFCNYFDLFEDKEVVRSRPELIIYADNFNRALSAVQMIPAALSVFLDIFQDVDQYTSRYGWELAERMPYLLHETPEKRSSVTGLAQAIKLVAKASHSKKLKYSILRYWASKKLCAVDYMVTHAKADYGAGLVSNPVAHTLFSQAIVLAYGAIEELGFEIKLITKKGFSADEVRRRGYEKLKVQLEKSGIYPDVEIFWSTASFKRKIDNNFKIESLKDIDIATNTKIIKLVDAIYFISRLRSNLSAHKFKKDTIKLTAKDVWNTQCVARYLICHQANLLDEMPVIYY